MYNNKTRNILKNIKNIAGKKYIRGFLIVLSFLLSGGVYIFVNHIFGYILLILLGSATMWNKRSSVLKEQIDKREKTDIIKEVEEESGVTFDKIYKYNDGFAYVRSIVSNKLFISDLYENLPASEKKFVLYHEASHIKTNDAFKNILLIIMSLISIAILIYSQLYILALLVTCISIIGLNKYSQNNEHKCDLYAIHKTGCDPEDIDTLDLFISKKSDKYSFVTKYFRTHPYSETRKQYIKENNNNNNN